VDSVDSFGFWPVTQAVANSKPKTPNSKPKTQNSKLFWLFAPNEWDEKAFVVHRDVFLADSQF